MSDATKAATMTMLDVFKLVQGVFEQLAQEYQDHQVAHYTVPSAPNTSTFRAFVNGSISVQDQVGLHEGPCNNRFVCHEKFLKVGTGLGYETICEIGQKLRDRLRERLGIEFHGYVERIECMDGVLQLTKIDQGSAWGGYGLRTLKGEVPRRPKTCEQRLDAADLDPRARCILDKAKAYADMVQASGSGSIATMGAYGDLVNAVNAALAPPQASTK